MMRVQRLPKRKSRAMNRAFFLCAQPCYLTNPAPNRTCRTYKPQAECLKRHPDGQRIIYSQNGLL
jgi:hypothetical protein